MQFLLNFFSVKMSKQTPSEQGNLHIFHQTFIVLEFVILFFEKLNATLV